MARAVTCREVLRSIQAGDLRAARQLAAWQGPFALTALHLAAACGSAETISALTAAVCPLAVPLEADLDIVLAALQQATAPKPPTARAKMGSFIWSAFGLLSQRQPEAWQSTMPAGYSSADAMAALWAREGDRAQTLVLPAGCERAFRKGATALHVACYLGRRESVEALLQAGAPPDILDHEGWTPLHYTTGSAPGFQRSHFAPASNEIAELLIRAGANCFILNLRPSSGVHITTPFAMLSNDMKRRVLDLMVELHSPGAEASMRSSSSGSGGGRASGSSNTGSGSNTSSSSGCSRSIGSSSSSSRPMAPLGEREIQEIVRTASCMCHVEAWRTFFPFSGLPHDNWRLKVPMNFKEDDPCFVLRLIEQGVDGADVDPWALKRAAEYGLVKTTEALILLGLPPVDEDAIRYCIKPIIGGLPQPATMRLLLEQRRRWGEPEGPPHVPLVANGDTRGPAFGVVAGQWRPIERADGPFWSSPIHMLLQLHLDLTELCWEAGPQADQPKSLKSLLGARSSSQANWPRCRAVTRVTPAYMNSQLRYNKPQMLEMQPEWRKRAVLCMEALGDMGVRPVVYAIVTRDYGEPGLHSHRRLREHVQVPEFDPLTHPDDIFDLAGTNRYLWLAYSRPPWASEKHGLYPPAFRAAARTLLLVAAAAGRQERGLGGMQGSSRASASRWGVWTLLSARGVAASQQPAALDRQQEQQQQQQQQVKDGAAAQCSLASLPPEVLLRIIQLAAQPISAWI